MNYIERLGVKLHDENVTIGEWMFEYVYDGYFAFNKGEMQVFCTPDIEEKGFISVQPDLSGDTYGELCRDIPYEGKLTKESFVTIMTPVLAQVEKELMAVRS